jgi:hypothetical protein
MASVITNADQATPEWLTSVLRQAGVLEHGLVTQVEKHTQEVIFGSFVSRLKLHYSDDTPSSTPRRLLLKVNSREVQFGIPGLGKKEPQFYNAVSDHMGNLPIVPCYSAIYSAAQGSYHLLLADLSDTHISFPPSQLPPTRQHCEMIVDALADVHAHWWQHPKLGKEIGEIPTSESLADEVKTAAEFFPKFVDFMEDRLSAARVKVHEQILTLLLPLLVEHFTTNLTLIFEDVHAGNFLYPRDPLRDRLYIIDWEQWGVDIAPHDLAYMMAMFWFPERRVRLEQSLLQRYHHRLQARGVSHYRWDDCWYDYRLSVMRLLFHPVWQWKHDTHPDRWFIHLERLHLAFEDLNCAELLQ